MMFCNAKMNGYRMASLLLLLFDIYKPFLSLCISIHNFKSIYGVILLMHVILQVQFW